MRGWCWAWAVSRIMRFAGSPAMTPGYVMRAMVARRVSAVTAACMLVRRRAFEAVGGFDAAALAVAFNDVDLCLKLSAAGWKIMYAAEAVAAHREGYSRGHDFDGANSTGSCARAR